jgi:hypothetical protein
MRNTRHAFVHGKSYGMPITTVILPDAAFVNPNREQRRAMARQDAAKKAKKRKE